MLRTSHRRQELGAIARYEHPQTFNLLLHHLSPRLLRAAHIPPPLSIAINDSVVLHNFGIFNARKRREFTVLPAVSALPFHPSQRHGQYLPHHRRFPHPHPNLHSSPLHKSAGFDHGIHLNHHIVLHNQSILIGRGQLRALVKDAVAAYGDGAECRVDFTSWTDHSIVANANGMCSCDLRTLGYEDCLREIRRGLW